MSLYHRLLYLKESMHYTDKWVVFQTDEISLNEVLWQKCQTELKKLSANTGELSNEYCEQVDLKQLQIKQEHAIYAKFCKFVKTINRNWSMRQHCNNG